MKEIKFFKFKMQYLVIAVALLSVCSMCNDDKEPETMLDLSEKVSLYAKFGFSGFRQYGDDHTGLGFNLNGNSLSLGMYYTF